MVNDHENTDEISDELELEDEDHDLESLLSDDSESLGDQATAIRPDLVDKVFRALDADAQRGDGELMRADVNRAYLRKELSIAECMVVEERLIATGYRILEATEQEEIEESDNSVEATINTRPAHHYLNEAEEKELGRQIQLALRLPEDRSTLDPAFVDRICKNAERAKTIFVASNIRYVELLARRMGHHRHLTLDDVIQEGVIGLLKAVNLYDPERGFRFKTYATWWIEQRMRRAIADCDRTIRLPVHLQEKIYKIKRAKTKLALSNGQSPSLEELAVAVGMDQEKLLKLLWRVQATDYAEGDTTKHGDDTTLLNYVPDSSEPAFDQILHQELQERFREVLATLTPREARILRLRFGIEVDQDYTLESIGRQYDMTRERVRQIEAKALNKLRSISRSDKLRDFLDS